MTPLSAIQGLVQKPLFDFLSDLLSAVRGVLFAVANKYALGYGEKTVPDSLAADTIADGIPFFVSNGPSTVASLNWMTTTTVSGDANNHAVINVVKWHGNTKVGTVGTLNSGSLGWVAGVDYPITVITTAGINQMLDGDWLSMEVAKQGTGQVVGRGTVAARVNPALPSSG